MTYCTGDPSKERLDELFEYRDGKLYNKTNRSYNSRMGMESGGKEPDGYRCIRMDGKKHRTHRLIYIMHNGDIPEKMFIDHKNGIKDDNRIENLRVVNNQENQFNTKAKGYCWNKTMQKYESTISINGVKKRLGYFAKEEDARQVYLVAKEKYHIIEKR